MEYSKKDKALIAACVVAGCVVLGAVGTVTLGIARYFMQGGITMADVSFLFILGLFVASALYARFHWKQRATFIAIGENHYEVAAVSRRDEELVDA